MLASGLIKPLANFRSLFTFFDRLGCPRENDKVEPATNEGYAMQSIQFSEDQFQRLSAVAHAAGYQDVSAFIASFADDPIEDPRGNVANAQLRENVAAMERGEAEIDAGGGQDMKAAIVEIANKYDLNI